MMTESSLELRHDYDGDRIYWYDCDADAVVDEITLPVSDCGCAVEQFEVSPSGTWIVTSRTSGQGEWGYDLIRAQPLQRVAGIPSRAGYTSGLPVFSPDESHLVGGYGDGWLGGWWADPDEDYYETPASGGAITLGWIFRHDLASHEVKLHELRMELPAGWIPDDPDEEHWLGPSEIEPLSDGGIKLLLPGGVEHQCTGPLPEVIELPVPHPNGGKLL